MVSFLGRKKEKERKKKEWEGERENLTAHFFNPCCDFYLISIFFGNKKLTLI